MTNSPDAIMSTPSSQAPATAEPVRYRIDPESYQAQGRSFSFILRQRMCEDSLAKLGEQTEVRVPVPNRKSKKVAFGARTVRYGDDPIAVIQECCSRTNAYRDPQLPLKEVLFRLLLAHGNRPKTVQELYAEVVEWVGFGDGRVITPQIVQRLLEQDDFYGFVPAPQGGS